MTVKTQKWMVMIVVQDRPKLMDNEQFCDVTDIFNFVLPKDLPAGLKILRQYATKLEGDGRVI